jgi:prophage regulatory protein
MTKMLRRLLRLSAVEDVTGMAKTAIYDAMERGVFPKPVPILEGGRAVGWVEDEIVDYIDARIALREEREALRAAKVERERRTVRLIDSGALPVHRFGRSVRVSDADIAQLMAASRDD